MDQFNVLFLRSQCNATESIASNPLFWALRVFQVCIGAPAIALNVAVVLVALHSVGLPGLLRRLLAILSVAQTVMAGYLVTKALHSFLTLLWGVCLLGVLEAVCELHEALFAVSLVLLAVCALCVAVERLLRIGFCAPTNNGSDRRRRGSKRRGICRETLNFWLCLLVLGCVSVAAVFLLLDPDESFIDYNRLPICTLPLAISNTELKFAFATLLIGLYSVACLCLSIAVCRGRQRADRAPWGFSYTDAVTVTDGCFGLIRYCALCWLFSLLASGAVMLAHALVYSPLRWHNTLFYAYEVVFYTWPLAAAFAYPFVAVGKLEPLKEQFLVLCPFLTYMFGAGSTRGDHGDTASMIPAAADLSFRTSKNSDYLDVEFRFEDDDDFKEPDELDKELWSSAVSLTEEETATGSISTDSVLAGRRRLLGHGRGSVMESLAEEEDAKAAQMDLDDVDGL